MQPRRDAADRDAAFFIDFDAGDNGYVGFGHDDHLDACDHYDDRATTPGGPGAHQWEGHHG